MLSKKVSKTVRKQTTAANAALVEFVHFLIDDPTRTVANPALGIGAMRFCFDDKDRMPDWVHDHVDLDCCASLSGSELLGALCALSHDDTRYLLTATAIVQNQSRRGRDLRLAIEFAWCQRKLEDAFADLLSPRH